MVVVTWKLEDCHLDERQGEIEMRVLAEELCDLVCALTDAIAEEEKEEATPTEVARYRVGKICLVKIARVPPCEAVEREVLVMAGKPNSGFKMGVVPPADLLGIVQDLPYYFSSCLGVLPEFTLDERQ